MVHAHQAGGVLAFRLIQSGFPHTGGRACALGAQAACERAQSAVEAVDGGIQQRNCVAWASRTPMIGIGAGHPA